MSWMFLRFALSLHKISCISAIKASFIAFDLHYLCFYHNNGTLTLRAKRVNSITIRKAAEKRIWRALRGCPGGLG